jgi:multimeric flavodoxin WrbA
MTIVKAAAVQISPDHEVSAIPITVAVLFHSGFGHTARQAEAVRRGIERVAGASALYLTSDEAQGRLDDLELADAIIFGAPTYMGSVSGPFKTFMDSTSKSYATGAWKDKIAAGFTNSASRSGDKLATLTQFAILRGTTWHALGQSRSAARQQQYARLGSGPQSARLLARCCGTVEQRSRA